MMMRGPRHTTAAGHVDLGTTPSPQAIAENSSAGAKLACISLIKPLIDLVFMLALLIHHNC